MSDDIPPSYCMECGHLPSADRHDELVGRVEDAIWSSLEEVAGEGMGFYVDREMDMVDGSGAGIDMAAVADRLIARLNLT